MRPSLFASLGIFAFGTLSFAAEPQPDTAAVKAEVAKVAGSYQLSKTLHGSCPASIKVEEDNFTATTTAGLGIYGDQPGGVVIQLDSLNSGESVQLEQNPMTGVYDGSEKRAATIGNGNIIGYSENDNALGAKRFRYDFSATYNGAALKYEVKYVGAFNGICFDNSCEYVRK